MGFKTYLRSVVSLNKTLYSLKVLVIPRKRWLRPDMTENLLTGTFNLNTNKPDCKATEDGYRLEITDLRSRGIILSL